MIKYFLSLLIFCACLHTVYGTVSLKESSTTSIVNSDIKIQNSNFDQGQYIKLLEMSVNALDKTNNALTQKWTPVSILLSVLSVLFSIITILWGIFFAFWIHQQSRLSKNIKDASILKNNLKVIESQITETQKRIKNEKNIHNIEKDLDEIQKTIKKGISLSESTYIPFWNGETKPIYLAPGKHTVELSNFSDDGYQKIKINGLEVLTRKK